MAAKTSNENADGTLSITLYGDDETILDVYTIDPMTGVGSASDGSEVNLPQTGVTSPQTAMLGFGAVGMTALGLFMIYKSGKRREED